MPSSTAKLQDQVVGVVEEGDRPTGERRQRPGEVEVAEADAEPGMLGDQRERVRPDAEARATRCEAAAAEARLAAEQPDGCACAQTEVPHQIAT